MLAILTSEGNFVLDTDVSDLAIGGELSQIQDGQERTIAYASVVLSVKQPRNCTTRKELLSVVKFTRQFSHYLFGRHFTVRRDHHSLTWLVNFQHPEGQTSKVARGTKSNNIKMEHRLGKITSTRMLCGMKLSMSVGDIQLMCI